MLKHHDWLFMSTWSSSNFNNIVQRMYRITSQGVYYSLRAEWLPTPTKALILLLRMWGFRDWALSDDERLCNFIRVQVHLLIDCSYNLPQGFGIDVSRDRRLDLHGFI